MTNMVSGSTQVLPNTGAGAPSTGSEPVGLATVAGGGAPITDQANAPMTSIVDAAIAEQLGTSVIGGGADAPSSDPSAGIPEFVRRFLPDAPASNVLEGAAPQGPPSKGGAPGQTVQQGWAWIGCHVPTPAPAPVPVPPPFEEMPPPPPGKGEEMPPPPGKGEPLPPPPGKGEPPTKGEPPVKGGRVERPDQKGSETYTVVKGDYLSKIAPRHGVTWQQLYWANRDQIRHPDLIHPGQVLKIPPCDLKVPNFDYTPMFTGPAAPSRPSRPPRKPSQGTPPPGKPNQGTPPSKLPSEPPTKPPSSPPGKPDQGTPPSKPPSKDEGPAKPPSDPSPSPKPPRGDRPPGSDPGRDATLPEAPPVPDGGELPPELPGS